MIILLRFYLSSHKLKQNQQSHYKQSQTAGGNHRCTEYQKIFAAGCEQFQKRRDYKIVEHSPAFSDKEIGEQLKNQNCRAEKQVCTQFTAEYGLQDYIIHRFRYSMLFYLNYLEMLSPMLQQ